jgi:hypothetical protein
MIMPYDFEKIKGQLIQGRSLITVHFYEPRMNVMQQRGVFLQGNESGLQYKRLDDIVENVTLLGEVHDEIETVLADEIKKVDISKLIAP